MNVVTDDMKVEEIIVKDSSEFDTNYMTDMSIGGSICG